MAIKTKNDEAQIVSAESRAYDINGQKGVSHKVRINVNGEIYSCNSNEEQVTALKSLVGARGEAVITFYSPRERLVAKLEEFNEE